MPQELFLRNKQLNECEIAERKVCLESKPRMLMIVLTNRCNLECIMCTRTSMSQERTLPFDYIRQVLEFFPYLEMIDWQGGEVFLVDYFKELFAEASLYSHIDQSIITNGLLINDSLAAMLSRAPKLNLTYSIDAVSKRIYEYIRKGARFEDLICSLERIREVNRSRINNPIQLHANVVIMRSNYKEAVLFPKFCKEYGISHLRFDFLRPQLVPSEDIILKCENEEAAYLRNAIEDITEECRDLGIWFECTFTPFLAGIDSQSKNMLPAVKGISGTSGLCKQPLKCKLPWKKLYIDAAGNGIVRPDCLCEQVAGNIFETTLKEIWNNSLMQAYRKKIAEGSIQDWCASACLNNLVDTYQLEGSH